MCEGYSFEQCHLSLHLLLLAQRVAVKFRSKVFGMVAFLISFSLLLAIIPVYMSV